MQLKHLNITVVGYVQGVGFRNATKHQARYLGIKGFVKNTSNGNVYIEAEAESLALAEFVKWCRKGPSFANVESLNVEEGPLSYFTTFDTRY